MRDVDVTRPDPGDTEPVLRPATITAVLGAVLALAADGTTSAPDREDPGLLPT